MCPDIMALWRRNRSGPIKQHPVKFYGKQTVTYKNILLTTEDIPPSILFYSFNDLISLDFRQQQDVSSMRSGKESYRALTRGFKMVAS